jgi:hypothetical protein
MSNQARKTASFAQVVFDQSNPRLKNWSPGKKTHTLQFVGYEAMGLDPDCARSGI